MYMPQNIIFSTPPPHTHTLTLHILTLHTLHTGSPHTHYGRHSLDAAINVLHGFYRTSALLWQCEDWKDWESLTKLYDIEHQWAQAVCCSLKVLVESSNDEGIQRRAPSLVEHYIQ